MPNIKKQSPLAVSKQFFEQPEKTTSPLPERVVYEKKRHGSINDFLKTKDGEKLQKQFSDGITDIDTFLTKNRQGGRFHQNQTKQLNTFRERIMKGSARGSYFSSFYDAVAGPGKYDFDRILATIKNPELDPQRIYDITARLPEDTNVCAPGTITNLHDIADRLDAATGGTESFLRHAYKERAEAVILTFVRKNHKKEWGYANNEIHYVNGYRNRLAENLHLEEKLDPFVPETVDTTGNVARCAEELTTHMSASRFVDHLSDRYSDAWKNTFPSKTTFTSDDFKSEQFEILRKTLDNQFGPINVHDIFQDNDDGSYALREDRTLLTRALAHNLRDLKLLEPFKSTTIAGDKQSGYVVKALGDLIYRKEYYKGQKIEQRPLQSSDLSEAWLLKPKTANFPSSIQLEHDLTNLSSSDVLNIAAENGNVEVVQALLEAGADVNAKNKNGETSLHLAAKNGHANLIGTLLDAGANIDEHNTSNNTALDLAIEHGHAEMLGALQEVKSDANVENQDVHTTLYQTAQHGHAGVVRGLLEAGAGTNAYDRTQSPEVELHLDLAIRQGNAAMLNDLLKAGADKHIENAYGRSALCRAAQCGNGDVVRLLLNTVETTNNQHTLRQMTLHLATINGNVDAMRAVLNAGVAINIETSGGEPMLHAAVRSGHIEAVRELCRAGMRIGIRNSSGQTVLHWAARHEKAEMVRELIKLGINIDKRDYNAKTALDMLPDSRYWSESSQLIREARWAKRKALAKAPFKALFKLFTPS